MLKNLSKNYAGEYTWNVQVQQNNIKDKIHGQVCVYSSSFQTSHFILYLKMKM